MIKHLGPIIYDFKRSFIRLSTLLLLSIFILSGVGLSYLIYISLSQLAPSVNIMAFAIDKNNTCLFTGLIHDVKGNLVNKAYLRIDSINAKNLYSKTVSGYFEFYDNELCSVLRNKTSHYLSIESSVGSVYNIPINSRPIGASWNATGVYHQIGFARVIEIYDTVNQININEIYIPGFTEQTFRGTILYNYIMLTRYSVKVLFIGVDFYNDQYRLNAVVKYVFLKSNTSMISPSDLADDLAGLDFNYTLGELSVNRFIVGNLNLSRSHNLIIFRIEAGNTTRYVSLDYSSISGLQTLESRAVSMLTSSAGLALFSSFFPIVFLYLAYALLAKPRSTGALEFVLARPVTKWDVYFTRYLAGVLTAFVSTTIFLVAMNITYVFLFGFTLDLYSNILIYIGLVTSQVVFYTLCYMIASSLRSGLYIALSILLFILFALLWNVVVMIITISTGVMDYYKFVETSYKLSYFNPLSPIDWAQYFVQKHYGIELIPVSDQINIDEILHPALVISTPLIWIIICFTIGYIVFKKEYTS